MKQRILVWDLPTRVFHWCLVGSFAGAMISAESRGFLLTHIVFGYLLLGLIGFRLAWGFVGSRYARFSDFVRRPAVVMAHLRSLVARNPSGHAGHNPAGAVAIIGLLVLGAAAALSGLATFNGIAGKPMKEFHEGVSYFMLTLAGAHVLGVLVTSALLRENLILSMFSGRKFGAPKDAARPAHGIVAIVLLLAVGAFAWALARGQLPVLIDPATLAERMSREHHHGRHR